MATQSVWTWLKNTYRSHSRSPDQSQHLLRHTILKQLLQQVLPSTLRMTHTTLSQHTTPVHKSLQCTHELSEWDISMVMKLIDDFSYFAVWQIKTFECKLPSVSAIQVCTRNWYDNEMVLMLVLSALSKQTMLIPAHKVTNYYVNNYRANSNVCRTVYHNIFL